MSHFAKGVAKKIESYDKVYQAILMMDQATLMIYSYCQ